MSRFWAAGSSSESDSDSDDSSVYSSSDDSGPKNQNRWVDMSDSSSEEENRVVKSGKERALETFAKLIKNLRKHMKDKDYYQIQCEFENLSKAMVKNKQHLKTGVPRPLVRILCDLEDHNAECLKDKEQFKRLSARQGRALNKMKLTLKKHNKAYSVVMDAYRKNPIVSDDEASSSDSSSGSSSSSSSSKSSKSSSSSSASSKSSDSKSDSDSNSSSSSGSGSSDDDSNVNWDSDSSASSSEEEDAGAYSQLKGRARWLKKNTVEIVKVTKNKDMRHKQRKEAAEAAEQAKALAAIQASKSILPEEGLTASILNRKVQEITALRGRRGKDNRAILRQLEALSRLSLQFGVRVEIPILMHVIAAQFGLQRTLDDTMETNTWRSCAAYLERIADVFGEGYSLAVKTIDESDLIGSGTGKMKAAANARDGAMAAVATDEKLVNPHTGAEETEDERAERLRLEEEAKLTDEEKMQIPVIGSLSLHLTRLEEEYTKSLQRMTQHSLEYVARLRDEAKLVALMERFQNYFESQNMMPETTSCAQIRLDHLYYRHDAIAHQVDRAALFCDRFGESVMLHPACASASGEISGTFDNVHPAAVAGSPVLEETPKVDFTAVIGELCGHIYKRGSKSAQTQAIIRQIFHHALHGRFVEARDLLLMSHLQESIYGVGDLATMVSFNRMMVTLGICAFRQGRINEAHQCLSEVCSGRVRELLAQGVQTGRFSDKTEEQTKAEKRRQIPFHQHINLDLLEACHLISAMLLEVPNMAQSAFDGESRRIRVISRSFRKFHDQYNHQVFTGPPEQTRDFVMRASMALKKGDWKTCSDLVCNLDVWALLPGENDAIDEVKTMLVSKVKLEGLRTYLLAFSSQYDSLSLSQLCSMFDMEKSRVHSIISKMIINRDLHASWDQPTETLVLRKVEPTSLQLMALQFAERAANLVEANERLLDAQSGGYGYKDEYNNDGRWQGNRSYQHRGGRGGMNRNRGGGRGGGGRGRGRRNRY